MDRNSLLSFSLYEHWRGKARIEKRRQKKGDIQGEEVRGGSSWRRMSQQERVVQLVVAKNMARNRRAGNEYGTV